MMNNFNEQNHNQFPEEHKPSNFKKFAKVTAYAAVFGLVAGVSFQGVDTISNYIGTYYESDDAALNSNSSKQSSEVLSLTDTSNNISTVSTSTNNSHTITDVSEVAENTMPSIVSIESTATTNVNVFGRVYQEESSGSGTGIIIGQNEKEVLIATNNHVVDGASSVQVTFIDESSASAQVKGTDPDSDLAVISIPIESLNQDTLNAIKIATLGDSNDVVVGEMAIAIGNALGYGQSVTVGYISAKDRTISVEDSTMTLLQTDAAINPGNSGGALLNINGEVIGINSIKFASEEVEGMGYAIPISDAIPIINDLMNREEVSEEERSYLGIKPVTVSESYSQRFNMPVGVYVGEVTTGSPAEKAGLQIGYIITGFNGKSVKSTESLSDMLSYTKAGTTIELTVQVLINGTYQEKVIPVELGYKDIEESTLQN